MSNLMEIIKSRRSTRAFKSELPPKDQVMKLVEAAEWAPSGMSKYLCISPLSTARKNH